MNVYAPLVAVIFMLGLLAEKFSRHDLMLTRSGYPIHRYTKNLFAILIAIILIVVAGLRYYVGTDYGAYLFNYPMYSTEPLTFMEPGIKIIARVAEFINGDYATMFFLASLITVTLSVWVIARKSDWFAVAILLYIFTGMWHGSFNGVRQFLAAAILFAGHQYIIDRKLVKWTLVVAVASLFHVTALVMFFWYFFATREINWKQYMFILLISSLGLYSYDYVWKFVDWIKMEDVNTTQVYMTSAINRLRILVQWMPVLFFLIFRPRAIKDDIDSRFFMNMSLLNAGLMTFAMNSAYLGRIGIYTGLFNVVLWPRLLKTTHGAQRAVFTVLLLVCFGVYWYYEVTGGRLATFNWIFDR